LVDADAGFRSTLRAYLQQHREAVDEAADGCTLRRRMADASFELVILDATSRDVDGLDPCRWIQGRFGVPVIALVPPPGPGPTSGAEARLQKPFELGELLGCVQRLARRSAPVEAGTVVIAGWRFDRAMRQLVSPGKAVVVLSNTEALLQSALVDNPGRLSTRDGGYRFDGEPGG